MVDPVQGESKPIIPQTEKLPPKPSVEVNREDLVKEVGVKMRDFINNSDRTLTMTQEPLGQVRKARETLQLTGTVADNANRVALTSPRPNQNEAVMANNIKKGLNGITFQVKNHLTSLDQLILKRSAQDPTVDSLRTLVRDQKSVWESGEETLRQILTESDPKIRAEKLEIFQKQVTVTLSQIESNSWILGANALRLKDSGNRCTASINSSAKEIDYNLNKLPRGPQTDSLRKVMTSIRDNLRRFESGTGEPLFYLSADLTVLSSEAKKLGIDFDGIFGLLKQL